MTTWNWYYAKSDHNKCPKLFGQRMKLVKELGKQFYIDADQDVLLKWDGRWIPWVEMEKLDKRFVL